MTRDWYDPSSLPKFDKPPVVETAMAMEFAPSPGLNGIDLVHMQDLWVERFPELSEATGAPPTSLGNSSAFQFQFGGDIPRRVWAAQPDSGLLLQTQLDRLILNWRRAFSSEPYPGYDGLRAEFEFDWSRMVRWMEERTRSTPSPHVVEFTYVNHVDIAPGESLSSLLTLMGQPEAELPGNDQLGQFAFTREVVANDSNPFAAQVALSGQPIQLGETQKVLAFTVTSRVLPADSKRDPISALDAAHALASHTFASAVTSMKQEVWGRTR